MKQKLLKQLLKILPEYTHNAVITRNNMGSDSITGLIGYLQYKIEFEKSSQLTKSDV